MIGGAASAEDQGVRAEVQAEALTCAANRCYVFTRSSLCQLEWMLCVSKLYEL